MYTVFFFSNVLMIQQTYTDIQIYMVWFPTVLKPGCEPALQPSAGRSKKQPIFSIMAKNLTRFTLLLHCNGMFSMAELATCCLHHVANSTMLNMPVAT